MTRRLLVFVPAICPVWAQSTLPQFPAENLAGGKVTMPGAVAGHPAVLVVGFTHASGVECTAWMKRLKTEFAATPSLQPYAVIFLEDAARLVRPMARSGIKSAPKEDYERWLIVTEHEKEMKAAVHFAAPDDPYWVVPGAESQVRRTGHGAVSQELVGSIRGVVK